MESKKRYEVDAAFIKEAYAAACQMWKRKLEKRFPDLFPVILIGKNYTYYTGPVPPVHIDGEKMLPYAGQIGKIVSAPRETEIVIDRNVVSKTMIEVLFNSSIYSVLYAAENVLDDDTILFTYSGRSRRQGGNRSYAEMATFLPSMQYPLSPNEAFPASGVDPLR